MKTIIALSIILFTLGCANAQRLSQGMNVSGDYNYTSSDKGIMVHVFFGADCMEIIADSVEINGIIKTIVVSENGQCVVLTDEISQVKAVYDPEIVIEEVKTNGNIMNMFITLRFNGNNGIMTVKYEVYILGDRTLKLRKIS